MWPPAASTRSSGFRSTGPSRAPSMSRGVFTTNISWCCASMRAARKRQTMTDNLSPREIVAELDRYIVGQNDAKRAVAVALRNRWRRQQLPDDLRNEVMAKNFMMVGPPGIGKPEIARRLAKPANAPFLKIEATKFTEVGY